MMKTVEVKVSELQGAALDWAVAVADGVQPTLWDVCCGNGVTNGNPSEPPECCCNPEVQVAIGFGRWSPSTDWSQGGTLIEKYSVSIGAHVAGIVNACVGIDVIPCGRAASSQGGPAHLIAACRAIVAVKIGDVVSVPAELA